MIIDGYKRAVACFELGIALVNCDIKEMTEEDKIRLDSKYREATVEESEQVNNKRKRIKPTKAQWIQLTKRSKCRCETCGEDFNNGSENILQAHHIDGGRSNTVV